MRSATPKRSSVFNKLKRTSVVIFLKKISWILIVISILAVSVLLGLWNVKNFDYPISDTVTGTEIEKSLSKYKGQNIFLVDNFEVAESVRESSGYIKKVYVKKILPNKLEIEYEEYIPFYSGYSSERCMLFSVEGVKILDVCEECEEICYESVSTLSPVFIVSDIALEGEGKLAFYEEFYKISRVLEEFAYDIEGISIKDGITNVTDIFGHIFTFDITYDLDIQLSRLFLVAQKINSDETEFKSLDLRFERPVMKIK